MDQDSGYLELVKDLTEAMEQNNHPKSSPSVSDLSSTASAASIDSPCSSSMTSISLSTPPPQPPLQQLPGQIFNRRKTDDLCETLQNHLFIQSVIPEERPNTLALRSSHSSLSSASVSSSQAVAGRNYQEQGQLEKLTQNLKEIDDFISVTEEILKRDRQRDEDLYARERQRKARQLTTTTSARPNSLRKSSSLRRKFSMIEKREAGDEKHTKLRQTRSTDGTAPPTINSNNNNSVNAISNYHANPAQFLGLQSRLNFQNGRVECVDPELRERNCVQKTHELVRNIIEQERVTPLVQPEHVDRVLLRNFRRGSVAVTTEDFEMTNVIISEDQQEIAEGTGPPIDELEVGFKELDLEASLCERETSVTDIEAPPPQPPPPPAFIRQPSENGRGDHHHPHNPNNHQGNDVEM